MIIVSLESRGVAIPFQSPAMLIPSPLGPEVVFVHELETPLLRKVFGRGARKTAVALSGTRFAGERVLEVVVSAKEHIAGEQDRVFDVFEEDGGAGAFVGGVCEHNLDCGHRVRHSAIEDSKADRRCWPKLLREQHVEGGTTDSDIT